MTEKRRTTITLDEDTFEMIDEIIDKGEYTYRNEVIRDAIEVFFNKKIHGVESEDSGFEIGKTLTEDSVYLVSVEGDVCKYLAVEDGVLVLREKTVS